MLRLLLPKSAIQERSYIADVVFNHFLGLPIELKPYSGDKVIITNEDQKQIVLDDSFFHDFDEPLARERKLPKRPCERCPIDKSLIDFSPADQLLPVLFGKPHPSGSFIRLSEGHIALGIDVLGSVFFMLTRFEETLPGQRDRFDRFPAAASVAYQERFLHRAIVNEYVELLWQCLKRLWHGLDRRKRHFRILLSHDVDQLYLLRNNGFVRMVRAMAGDAIRRTSPLQAFKRPAQWVKARALGPEYDPAYTFDYMMDVAESNGLRSAFYFIPGKSAGPPDYRYGIRDADIQTLIYRIDERGHEVGYHASIETYHDADLIKRELQLLRDGCQAAGVQQNIEGSRQHYLRIDTSVTLRHLADAGLTYDTTLTFADYAGFRCGTCWEYPFYDLRDRAPLHITVRPLIVMEGSVVDDEYMGLGYGDKAHDFILSLARVCRRHCGDFTLLWHNTRLTSPHQRRLFEDLLQQI